MKRVLLAAASVAVLSAFSVPAQASHIFVSNVGINGSPLDSISGPTNPIFNVTQGGSLTFTGDMQGSGEALNVVISGISGLSQNSFSVLFGGGTASFSQAITFNTVGMFNGSVNYDFPSSFPDYMAPDGQEFSERTLGFSVNVISGAVPEPATWMFMLLGMGGIGYSMRRKNKQTVRVQYA